MKTSKQEYHFTKQKKYFKDDFDSYDEYEESLNAWRWTFINRIKKSLLHKNYKNKTLLDIGCGSGYISIEISKLGLKVIASDIVPLALKKIEKYCKKSKLKSIKTLECSAEKIPLKSNSIDYIVATSVLEHVWEQEKAIKEWKRVLKPKGRIFITVPLKLKYILPVFWPIMYVYDRMLGHLRRYDLPYVKEIFKMKVIKVYYSGHLIKFLWFLISRPFIGGLKKSSDIDYLIEDIDQKFEKFSYGGMNLSVVLEKI